MGVVQKTVQAAHEPSRIERFEKLLVPLAVAAHLPASMLCVPSIGGISHDFSKVTAEADIVLGFRLRADLATSILGEGIGC